MDPLNDFLRLVRTNTEDGYLLIQEAILEPVWLWILVFVILIGSLIIGIYDAS